MRAARPGLAISPGTVPPGCRALLTTGSATRDQLDLQFAASVEFEMVQQRLFPQCGRASTGSARTDSLLAR
jgi:hypothetical protein